MPELPEVETVRRGLAPRLVGHRIASVDVNRPDLRFPFPDRFAERLTGQRVKKLERRAKYLVAELSSGDDLVMHLGMSGRFTILDGGYRRTPGKYVHAATAADRHDHVVFHFSDGGSVAYNDARRFGYMLLIPHAERDAHPLFHGLGVEPLGGDLTGAYLARRARGKSVSLKAFLMDQRIVAGLGNIYVSEALWGAALSPKRAASTLAGNSASAAARAMRLAEAIIETLRRAIDAGGSTLRDYRRADGALGEFQQSFAVYGRAGQKCLRPGCGGTVRRLVQGARATFYCPRCQR